MSPELALVDPETRAIGIALLGQDLAFAPVFPSTRPDEPVRGPARRGRALAVGAYAAVAALRMLVLDAMFVLVVVVLVLVLNLVG